MMPKTLHHYRLRLQAYDRDAFSLASGVFDSELRSFRFAVPEGYDFDGRVNDGAIANDAGFPTVFIPVRQVNLIRHSIITRRFDRDLINTKSASGDDDRRARLLKHKLPHFFQLRILTRADNCYLHFSHTFRASATASSIGKSRIDGGKLNAPSL